MADIERLLLIAPPLMQRTPAFDRAAALAKVKSAALHIVAFDYVEGIASAGLVNETAIKEVREGYLHSHRQWLDEQAKGIHHMGVQITTEVMWVKRPQEEILTHVRDMKPAMVIKDLQHESWLTRALFTTLDMRLLYDCEAPLHLVAKVQHGIPRKIVAAVDPFRLDDQFERLNDRIIRMAEQLASQCDAQLDLLYAYDLSYIYALDGGFGYQPSVMDELYDNEMQVFHRLADRFGVPADRRHMITGNPARVIESFMTDNAVDVVVLGTVHRDAMNKLLGSTTEQLANHLPSSLLTINPRSAE
ncbi:universal stress protein [Pseudomonas sp. GD03842]|uniref:universal stress protein n=1 Tax=unclassified Pseudomonas TaxID=196821 RepID=UPI0015AF5898|nr:MULTISPECIES: universal stress protein [unclassified Pseudomonas]MDH0747209.1 universal stress protein [Pseudomonas sp. GD03842]